MLANKLQYRYDFRLTYRDLNNMTSLNSLTQSDKETLWAPQLAFTNALGPFQTGVDDTMAGFLVREGSPQPEDMTMATEG